MRNVLLSIFIYPTLIFSQGTFKDFNDTLLTSGGWSTHNVIGSIDWGVYGYSLAAEIKNVDLSTFTNYACESWLISPFVNFTNITNPYLSFMNSTNYSGPPLEVFVSNNYDGISSPSVASWASLSFAASGGNWSWVSSGVIDLTNYISDSVFIGFKYTGTSSSGATWIIDDIFIGNCTGLNNQTTVNEIICDSFYMWDNNQIYNQSGTYIHNYRNIYGCDSIVTLNLTLSYINPDFTVSSNLFSAPPFAAQFTNTTPNASNYNFTWDFSDGTILQSNNTLVFHEYMYNGLYDVTLIAEDINTGCTDTVFYDDYIFCTGGTSCTHASTINQSGPITACVSDSVYLTCNTDPNFTYQWRLNGTYIPGAVDTIYYPTQTGNYSVLILENGCPEVSPDVSVVMSSSPQTPIITSSGNITPCLGGSVTLSVPSTYSSYSWSSGGTSSSEVVTSSGSYFVTVSNSTGCEATSPTYTINASFATPPDVCIVGVDSITNYNKVVWEKPISTAIDSFYVYKETNQANIYQKIGGTSYSDTAVFDDLSSNPSVQAYRYRLSLVDSCGVESSLGSMHKSIHLTINQGVGTTWNLIWSHYEGFTFPSYNIYRGTSSTNMTLLTTIASNLNSYTDLTAPTGQLYYQIEVVSGYTCDPLKSNYNTSKSNVVDNAQAPSIIVQNENRNVNVYPNPTNDQITIDIKGYNGDVNIEVYDLQGRLLETTNSTTVSLRKYERGIYIFKISYGEITEEVRVVRD